MYNLPYCTGADAGATPITDVFTVPEPSTLALLLTASLGLGGVLLRALPAGAIDLICARIMSARALLFRAVARSRAFGNARPPRLVFRCLPGRQQS